MQSRNDEGVMAPLGTAILIGIVVLMAVGLTFMIRIFTDRGSEDPQALAVFQVDESQDTLVVSQAEAESLRSEYEIRVNVAGDFDTAPLSSGAHALEPGEFVPLGGAPGGPADGKMTAGSLFYFCAEGGSSDPVAISIRHIDSNSVIWRGSFNGLDDCP